MIQGVKALSGFTVRATDGVIGKVRDVYFDDRYWVIRYAVVELTPEFKGKVVLLAPVVLKTPRWAGSVLPVSLTSEQVRKSPEIDTDKPVSRQQGTELSEYFGWPTVMGPGSPPLDERVDMPERLVGMAAAFPERAKGDPHLRSANEVTSYRLQATDGEAGKVKDILISDAKWVIRYLLADAGQWIFPKPVLISPEWVDRISWDEKKVHLDLDRKGVQESPPHESLSTPFRSWREYLRKNLAQRGL